MKRKRIIIVAAFCCIVAMLASCINDDYSLSPMKWTGYGASVPNISVGPEGGSFDFNCRNYNSIWFTYIAERRDSLFGMYNDSIVYTYPEQGNNESNYTHIADSCVEATCANSDVHITVKPNTTGKKRYIEVGVTAGDIFDGFEFTQEK